MAIQFKPEQTPARAAMSGTLPSAQPKQSISTGIFDRFIRPVKPEEVMFFTSQLSLMLEIDAPVAVALKTIANEVHSPAFKTVITAMSHDIEDGRQLSEAMKRHPRIFNDQFVSMVKAGETGGFLNKILDRTVEMQEKRQVLKAQLTTALTYPAVLCVLGLAVVVFILVGVLPKFAAFFKGKEAILPWTTRFLMTLSTSLQHYWWVYILSSAGLVLGLVYWGNSAPGRALRDRLLISGPFISGLANKIYTCEMLRMLGHMLESHVPLLEALRVIRPTIGNRYYRRFVDRIRANVDQGGRFSQPFAAYPYIPQTVKQMVVIGEETGKLPVVMLRLVQFYSLEIEQDLKKFAARVEPAALIVMGAIIGLIVSSITLPLLRLSQALR